ncbi:hypothetical protein [Rhodoferax sp.]|uniref:hypothetical protein n=1 Tax=Rhodoferax sp. TaxID=50421 RepID=UPI003454D7DB
MAMHIDICNGDADGLCSVVQWRLHEPRATRLITGLKRDIELLARVQAAQGDALLVCDISMQRNRQPLMRLLEAGVSVRYFDHHKVDQIPVHPLLDAHIDVASDTCTSLLVDRYLNGEFRAWAAVGAFGDNLTAVAESLAVTLGLSFEDRRRLQSLGESINYNAYGDSEQDVHISPAHLYDILVRYRDPLNFLKQEVIGQELEALRQDDMQRAQALPPYLQDARVSVYLLPDAPWARRVSGSLSNYFASAQPLRAHAVLKARAAGDFEVSVRAPLHAPGGAAEFCRRFGGDGRAAAAGIDHLPADQLERFIAAISANRWGDVPTEPDAR